MRIDEVPAVDVRKSLTAHRGRLLSVLASLTDTQWAAPTAAPQWQVKDIALHLLGVDLSWIARYRDHHRTGSLSGLSGHEEFVRGLAQHNQRWIDGTRQLSPQLITALLHWSGEQLDACLGTADLDQPRSVYWAGDVPLWFDLAREFTERWVHGQQIREAVRPAGDARQLDDDLPLVLRTFIWGYPHQYQVVAAKGTTIAVDIAGIGTWTLTRTAAGWDLDEGQSVRPAASLQMTADAAWRLLTGARYDPRHVRTSGEPALTGPLLEVRGIIV
jgi:uncharacterized protein (TIGR03083 family)